MDRYTLRQWRGLRELTLQELSDATGLSTVTLSSYENDIRKMAGSRVENATKIAEALGIKVEQIIIE